MISQSKASEEEVAVQLSDEWNKSVSREALLEGLVRLAIEYGVMALLFFVLIGRNTNYENVSLFVYGITLLAVTLIPSDVITYLYDKLKETASKQDNKWWLLSLSATWQRTWLIQPVFSGFMAVVSLGLVWLIESYLGGLSLWITLGVVFLLNVVLVNGLVWFYSKRIFNQLRKGSGCQGDGFSVTLDEATLYAQLLIRWAVGLIVVAVLVTVKTIDESVFTLGENKLTDYAFSIVSAGYVISVWCCYGGQEFIKQIVTHLSVNMQSRHDLSLSDTIFLLHASAGATAVVLFGFSWLFDPGYWVSLILSVFMIVVVGCVGLVLGAVWRLNKTNTTVVNTRPENGRLKLD